ncbi:hypothetical protein SSTU70S_05491 [Stutzerimonas stutzeri]
MENTAVRSPEFIAEQAEVLKKGDPFVALEFAIKHNDMAAISELESVVCSDPYGLGIACRFAKEVKGANVSKLEDYTLSLGDSLGVLEFAKEVPGANIAKLEQGLIERNMHDIAGPFAAEVPGANVESLQALVLTSKSPWSICEFAMNVPSADMTQLAQAAADVRIEHAGIYRNGADQTPEKMAAFDLLRMKGKFPDLDLSEVRIHYRDDTKEVYDDLQYRRNTVWRYRHRAVRACCRVGLDLAYCGDRRMRCTSHHRDWLLRKCAG